MGMPVIVDQWDWRSMSEVMTRMMMNIALPKMMIYMHDSLTTLANYIIVITVIIVLRYLFYTCLFVPCKCQ